MRSALPLRPHPARRLKKLRRCTCGDETQRRDLTDADASPVGETHAETPAVSGAATNRTAPPQTEIEETEDDTGSFPSSHLARERGTRRGLHQNTETPASTSSPSHEFHDVSRNNDSASDETESVENDDDDETNDERDETKHTSPKQRACQKCAAAFYAELEREMTAASKAYFGWTLRILTRAPLAMAKSGKETRPKSIVPQCASRWPSTKSFRRDQPMIRLGKRFADSRKHAPDLKGVDIDPQTEARECLRWVDLNATALRKILKKWDKTNESNRGRKALTSYWKKSQYQMLHSPVTLELKAVAGMLQWGTDGPVWNTKGMGGEGGDDDASFGTYPNSSFGSVGALVEMDKHVKAVTQSVESSTDNGNDRGTVPTRGNDSDAEPALESTTQDDEYDTDTNADNAQLTSPTCSICLDTLYKPVGLECGHVFCRDCLLRCAGVLDHEGTSIAVTFRGRQTVQNVARGEALSEPVDWLRRDKCPECRQEGVFLTSTRLRHVEACIKRVDPEGHALRRVRGFPNHHVPPP